MSEFTPYVISMKNGHKFVIGIKDIDVFNKDMMRSIGNGNRVGATNIKMYIEGIGIIDAGDISAVYPQSVDLNEQTK